ncbi:unnamed protein product [Nezara viridula]|uniref:Uncharacterized protein n=1 Tax=Nezara viridula TaxID=85310 RepID=A0A9P0HNW2_NEZVI|nr:unnamed protein product [Nezara viridula]
MTNPQIPCYQVSTSYQPSFAQQQHPPLPPPSLSKVTALHNSRPELRSGALNTPTNSISDWSRWEEVTSPHVQITEAIAAHASHGLSHHGSSTSANPETSSTSYIDYDDSKINKELNLKKGVRTLDYILGKASHQSRGAEKH